MLCLSPACLVADRMDQGLRLYRLGAQNSRMATTAPGCAVGVQPRQFGERTERRRAGDRPAVGVGAMRQDRDQPKVRRPAGGQQLLPEFGVELDGGMEASTPRADVDGAGWHRVRRVARSVPAPRSALRPDAL